MNDRSTTISDEAIAARLGFSPGLLLRIGSVAALAARIEYQVELAIWEIKKEKVEGLHPSTDGKTISALIKMIVAECVAMPAGDLKKLSGLWTDVAWLAFSCRNTIFHGVATRLSKDPGEIDYIKAPGWHGEQRKRETKTFIANEHTLNLLIEVFEALAAGIELITRLAMQQPVFLEPLVLEHITRQLRSAWSIAAEIDDLPAAVNHEKY